MNTYEYVIEQSQKCKSPSQIYQILKDKYGEKAIPLSIISYTIRKQSWSMRNQTKAKNFELQCSSKIIKNFFKRIIGIQCFILCKFNCFQIKRSYTVKQRSSYLILFCFINRLIIIKI